MTGPMIVRGLWVALALGVLLVLLLRWMPVKAVALPADVAPLPLPSFNSVTTALASLRESAETDRNPFDPKGEPWIAQREAPRPAPRQNIAYGAPSGVLGLIKVPGLEGALTREGFVSIGGTVGGAEVKQVGRDEIVFSFDETGEKTANWNNEDRQRRRETFERLGLTLPGQPAP